MYVYIVSNITDTHIYLITTENIKQRLHSMCMSLYICVYTHTSFTIKCDINVLICYMIIPQVIVNMCNVRHRIVSRLHVLVGVCDRLNVCMLCGINRSYIYFPYIMLLCLRQRTGVSHITVFRM